MILIGLFSCQYQMFLNVSRHTNCRVQTHCLRKMCTYKTNFPHSHGWQLVHVYKVPEVGIKIPSHIMYSNHLTMGVEIAIGWCWWRRYFGRHKLACVWIFLTGNIYFAMRDTLEILCPFGRGGGGRSFKSSFLLPCRLVCSSDDVTICNNAG